MKIVIDSNRVIASLIKEGTTREILFDKKFEFFAPEFIKSEIDKYKEDYLGLKVIFLPNNYLLQK